ncbi:Protein of uncharacterised function (DUF3040) [Actinomyces bovis]|uniref:Protein of uncharacterized function (DUF3040) n=1 Tax=Actinomyces bovis TaxID=1658 RepID=A0ABY1VR66_9ACTO|nr:DUF3040 domain-containing protein [Actinomyces bovis]SPT53922.1 Protein of uncharacterised function (DUF3040) [Actinomyces bovis]VEG53407.1 Protein of uncharacterised function (DUF3040) [Actinomyces israelii]
MALSERDERMLREMERQFSTEDPYLAQTMSNPKPVPFHFSPRRIGGGVALALLGLVALIAGVTVRHSVLSILLGLLGFALAVLGVMRALSREPVKPGTVSRGTQGESSKGSFMSRQEELWERRRQSGR